MTVTWKLEGFDKMENVLKNLPKNVQNKLLANACQEALKPAALAILDAAPVSHGERSPSSEKYGHLRDNLRIYKMKFNQNGEKGARIDTGKAFWAFFLELGTRYIAAMPFFQNTFARMQDETIEALGNALASDVESEAVKLGK